ncbi:hypothetical protein IV38_GL002137 [Lactobacillus selangorensis]|uniref:Uncharacterized protein n=1 Tax=Lactobacillus selangorensis TaxID=81857 RepID=A0A0R2FIJ6_9LACO|nr:hypothetical protein [Lactobacillus selangorensis]KRN27483.1 hypothetical protein IV38_GL002137 [Lactobacillus selangorensis]KRN31320.1 hypothetical protein IV40_GL001313 [Lactobacillus selangorensis]
MDPSLKTIEKIIKHSDSFHIAGLTTTVYMTKAALINAGIRHDSKRDWRAYFEQQLPDFSDNEPIIVARHHQQNHYFHIEDPQQLKQFLEQVVAGA